MPDYRIKLHAYLSVPDRPVWNAPLEHLACLNNLPLTRSDLTKLHGIASSSDRLNLPNNGCDLNSIQLKGDRKPILVELIPELIPTSRC